MTLFARLLLVAAVLPFAFAHFGGESGSDSSCGNNEFYYGEKSCCLPHGGVPNPPSPPSGASCPSSWYWHGEKRCCVPNHPPTNSSPPSCSSGWTWDYSGWHCSPHNPTTPSQPTPTTSHHTTPTAPPQTTTQSAPPPTSSSTDCPQNHWYWGPKDVCVPHGGSPNPPTPPSGRDCPSNWEWHTGKECCRPHHPQQPPPQCGWGWGWNDGSKCCFPHGSTSTTSTPQPSGKPGKGGHGGYWKRTHAKSRASSLCPEGLEACPLSSLTGLSGGFECADIQNDIQSCGGCASTGAGQDCTTIDGAWNVGCNAGKCVVLSCTTGYKRSADGSLCILL